MADYVTAETLRTAAIADDASPEGYWEQLATAVSRLFDRTALVADGFFSQTPGVATKNIQGVGKFILLPPYAAGTITEVKLNSAVLGPADYSERDSFLVLKNRITENDILEITATFGILPSPDIVQACIEQGLLMWRRKDLSFTDISGVATAAVTAALSPTFDAVAARYRAIYGNSFFA